MRTVNIMIRVCRWADWALIRFRRSQLVLGTDENARMHKTNNITRKHSCTLVYIQTRVRACVPACLPIWLSSIQETYTWMRTCINAWCKSMIFIIIIITIMITIDIIIIIIITTSTIFSIISSSIKHSYTPAYTKPRIHVYRVYLLFMHACIHALQRIHGCIHILMNACMTHIDYHHDYYYHYYYYY